MVSGYMPLRSGVSVCSFSSILPECGILRPGENLTLRYNSHIREAGDSHRSFIIHFKVNSMNSVAPGIHLYGKIPMWLLLAVLPLGIAGCGESGPPKAKVYSVTGKVTGGSGDLTGCLIIFHPVDPKETSASGTIKEGGAYSLEAADGRRGCPAGQYKVTLQMTQEAVKEAMMKTMGSGQTGPPAGMDTGLFPEKYSNVETTDKMVEVKEETNTIDIQL